MTAGPLAFDRLTPAERECLRLVHQGFGSKQIAERRHVRADRIDKIVNSARAKLGDLPRREAARLFAEWEARKAGVSISRTPADPAQKLGAQDLGLDREPETLPPPAIKAPGRIADGQPGVGAPGYDAAPFSDPADVPDRIGSGRNALDRLPRLAVILLIAALGAVTAGAALSLLFVLDHLVAGR